MTTHTRQQVRQVFMDLADLPEAERADALNKACDGNPALRAEVEALLQADQSARGFMNAPTANIPANSSYDATIAAPLREGPGTKIGPYKILQLVGEGGFGSVFMAEQSEPVKRKVALKIIKLGMDTRQVVARFEQERQALAMMDHPNIARVLDAGATEAGRPFFVMELVKGDPIVEYCDKNNLSIKERLELFAQVCHAVQHAHTKGIIHRDIKPSNILVSTLDGRPNTKVIDFGIAKATSAQLTEKTLFTEHRQLIGTPEYMSPEQAEGSMDIDTRTDVYSLGVLLYELLTGSTPFAGKDLRSAAYAEIQRIIREVDPPKPSTRLSESTETIGAIAGRRHVEPRKLGTILRGELDWIVMRALEKDRQRRYETANGLALDIARYLSGEAIVAAPPGAAYRIRKFIKRNRVVVLTGSAVTLSLIVGLAAFAWQFTVAASQRDRAVQAEADTKSRADELAKVSEFQANMLAGLDTHDAGEKLMTSIRSKFAAALENADVPQPNRSAEIQAFSKHLERVNATDTATELIDQTILKPAIAAVDTQFKDQPIVDAKLRHTLAELYRNLGLYDAAAELAQQSLTIRRSALGEDHPDTITSLADIAVIAEARGNYPDAEKFYTEALEKRRRVKGEDDPQTIVSTGNLGNFYRATGKYAEAEPLLRATLENSRRIRGSDNRDTLIAMNTLGFLFISQGKLADAEPLWREAYERGRKAFGDEDRDVLVWTNNLGGLLQAQGKFADSEVLFRESVAKHRKILGETHPSTLQATSVLASSLTRQGKYDEAETLSRSTLDTTRRVLGSDHPETLSCVSNLGFLLFNRGRLTEAEGLIREGIAARKRTMGDTHPDTLVAISQLARVLALQGNDAEAEALFRSNLATLEQTLGAEHPDALIGKVNLANALIKQARADEAEPIIREALEARRRVSGENHPETLVALSNLAAVLELQGKLTESLELNQDVTARFRKTVGDRHPSTINSIGNLAYTLLLNHNPQEAEALYREALAASQKNLGDNHPNVANLKRGLGDTLVALNRFADAEPILLDAERGLAASAKRSQTRYPKSIESIIALYEAWNKAEPSKGFDAKSAEWKLKLDAYNAQPDTSKP